MSEQIREQVSAFLDGELPNSETELLLKRLARDGDLREHFGRYALIGEALRGPGRLMAKGFAGRVNLGIDGEPLPANGHMAPSRAPIDFRIATSRPFSVTSMMRFEMIENDATSAMNVSTSVANWVA